MITRTYCFDSNISPCRVEILMKDEIVLVDKDVVRLRFNIPMRVLKERSSAAGYTGELTVVSVAELSKLGVPCFDAITQIHPFDVRVTAYNPVAETNYQTTLLGCWFTTFENDVGQFSYVTREVWKPASAEAPTTDETRQTAWRGDLWRTMEQFQNIAEHQPVFAGDLIAKPMVKDLLRAGLITKNSDGDYVLSSVGKSLWATFKAVGEKEPPQKHYLCYAQLHIGEHSFFVHYCVPASSSNEALNKYDSVRGDGWFMQVKGTLGLVTDDVTKKYLDAKNQWWCKASPQELTKKYINVDTLKPIRSHRLGPIHSLLNWIARARTR